MPWLNEIRHPDSAPRDGSGFWVLRTGYSGAIPALWDSQMGCFLGFDFAIFDQISAWWPFRAGFDPYDWQIQHFEETS